LGWPWGPCGPSGTLGGHQDHRNSPQGLHSKPRSSPSPAPWPPFYVSLNREREARCRRSAPPAAAAASRRTQRQPSVPTRLGFRTAKRRRRQPPGRFRARSLKRRRGSWRSRPRRRSARPTTAAWSPTVAASLATGGRARSPESRCRPARRRSRPTTRAAAAAAPACRLPTGSKCPVVHGQIVSKNAIVHGTDGYAPHRHACLAGVVAKMSLLSMAAKWGPHILLFTSNGTRRILFVSVTSRCVRQAGSASRRRTPRAVSTLPPGISEMRTLLMAAEQGPNVPNGTKPILCIPVLRPPVVAGCRPPSSIGPVLVSKGSLVPSRAPMPLAEVRMAPGAGEVALGCVAGRPTTSSEKASCSAASLRSPLTSRLL
jgi:hypothetical protein